MYTFVHASTYVHLYSYYLYFAPGCGGLLYAAFAGLESHGNSFDMRA